MTGLGSFTGVGPMQFVTGKRSVQLDLGAAISDRPALTRTMDGASTLEIVIKDRQRKILRSGSLNRRSWITIGTGKQKIHFEYVALEKNGTDLKLTFEDAIAAALRRRKDQLVIPPGSSTRHGVVARVANDAEVPFLVDDSDHEKVHNKLIRGPKADTKNSWDFLGSAIAEPRGWRRFTDGRQLVVGPDKWLLARDQDVTVIRENTGPFGWIDFDLDTGGRVSEATVDVDLADWSLPPGSACQILDMGPADGKWLVFEIPQTLGSNRAQVKLVRAQHELDEPKRESSGGGDPGSPDYIPGNGDGADTGGSAANPARAKMVAFALAQRGDQYEWGGNGPSQWDCSGLVQAATAAAGHQLTKPSASQAAAVAAAGKGMSVDAAIRTRGALLFRMGSPYNHVAISLGNGQTIEAMGEAYGVCIGSANGRGWTSAGWWV